MSSAKPKPKPFINVTEEQFTELLKLKLDSFWNRSVVVFHNYGDQLSYYTTTALFFATLQGRVHKVLNVLELHHKTGGATDLEATVDMFSRIWNMLGVQNPKKQRLLAA